ncbi:hypothetical protein BJY01DRAFT_247265 [Aspergillus pseudoustus]|uniref:Uncharacterized protein n=1 Tax=Aspergillus pseudoustus TaxID=1810923 RepID=A0ABR4K237_9EURO
MGTGTLSKYQLPPPPPNPVYYFASKWQPYDPAPSPSFSSSATKPLRRNAVSDELPCDVPSLLDLHAANSAESVSSTDVPGTQVSRAIVVHEPISGGEGLSVDTSVASQVMCQGSWKRTPWGKGFAVLVAGVVVVVVCSLGSVVVEEDDIVIGWKHAFAAVSGIGIP